MATITTPNDIRRVAGDALRQPGGGARTSGLQGARNGKLIDYDELGRTRLLEKFTKGLAREQVQFHHAAVIAPQKSLAQRTQDSSRPVRSLSREEISRHAKLSGNSVQIGQKALAFLRDGQPRQAATGGGGRAALQQYLALQKLKSALASGNQQELVAQMAPLPDFSGDAGQLARRFYEASGDDDQLSEMLSGFGLGDDERERAMKAIRECPHHHETGYQTDRLAQVLAKAMRIDDVRPSAAEAASLRANVDDALAELESSQDVGRYINGTLNIADEAEKTADPARFADDYADLVHGSEAWGEKCMKVLDRYMKQGSGDALQELPRTLQAASRAADLDLHAEFPSTDKVRLQAAVESLNLIVRMRTVSEMVEESAQFMERHHGKSINPSDLLRGALQVFASPYSAASAMTELASRLGVNHPDESITLFREIGRAVRLMQQVFPDANAVEAARTGIQDTLDSAVADEEILLDQIEASGPAAKLESAAEALTFPGPAPQLMP